MPRTLTIGSRLPLVQSVRRLIYNNIELPVRRSPGLSPTSLLSVRAPVGQSIWTGRLRRPDIYGVLLPGSPI